jgi:hypothetical protein
LNWSIIKTLLISLLSACTILAALMAMRNPQQFSDTSYQTGSGRQPWTYDGLRSALEMVDNNGLVDYRRLKANREPLDQFASRLADLDPQTFAAWGSTDRMSLWINAYNGLTLIAILDNYPIQSSFLASLRFPKNSIRQISGVWDRLEFEIMGRPATLDQIEHEILRREFDDPRIHFALVCAAMGCPPLRNEPYLGDRLGDQLDDQVRQFLENSEKFRIDRSTNTVYLSKILDWYGEDFSTQSEDSTYFRDHGSEERAVLRFISEYLSPEDRTYLRKGTYRLRYLEYDWSLNER